MKIADAAAILMIMVGAAIMLVSLTEGLRIKKEVSAEMRAKWLLAVCLLAFFFVGYVLSIFAVMEKVYLPLELLMGGVFFGGAFFVYIVITLTRTTVHRINEKDRHIEEYSRGLTERTLELEREMTERIRAQEEASSRLQYLSALHEIDMIISSSLDLDFTLRGLLEQSVSHLKVDAACVLLLNPSTQVLSYAAGLGFRTNIVEESSLRMGEGSAGLAAIEKKAAFVPQLEEASFDRPGLVSAEGFVSYCAVPLVAKGQVKGVFEVYSRTPLDRGPEWNAFLRALALQTAIAIENITLFNDLQRSHSEIILAYDTTLEGWSRALELRDEETEGHTQRVVETTLRVARAMGVKEEDMVHVRRGALLHDIGKMSIPDSILLKTGSLNEAEWEVMRRHPTYAFELLSPIAYLRPALDIPYCHHEKWDGTGYPRRLKGEQIPLPARIFAVVDMWDALRSERRYNPSWPRDKACTHIESLSGSHFDPKVVRVFMELECKQAGGQA